MVGGQRFSASSAVIALDSAEFAPIAALLAAWAEPAPPPVARAVPLRTVAQQLGLNERLLARRFAAWAGVSATDFRARLCECAAEPSTSSRGDGEGTLQSAAYSLSLNGTGVLASKIVQVTVQAEEPTAPKRHLRTPFGTAELTLDAEGRLQGLKFLSEDEAKRSKIARAGAPADAVEERWAERLFGAAASALPIPLVLGGTAFQCEVWRALLARDTQECTDYGTLAKAIDRSGATRAVGTAVGANPIGWLIPCHHVLRADGSLGGFRWGVARKRAMLVWESLPPS